jgi:hypothetical protein
VVEEGQPVAIDGSTPPPHPGATILVEFRRPERRWQPGPETVTDAEGRFHVDLMLPATGFWQVRATVVETGDEDHLGGTSLARYLVEVRG